MMDHIHLYLVSDGSHPFAKDFVILNQIGHTTVSTVKILINAHNSITCGHSMLTNGCVFGVNLGGIRQNHE